MRKVFLSVCVVVVLLVAGFGFGSQPAQSQGRHGPGVEKTGTCGGQALTTTSAVFPGIVVDSVTFDLADVGAFPGDTTVYQVHILYSAESSVSAAGTFSGIAWQIDGGGAFVGGGPEYFDNSVGPGTTTFGVRTTSNVFGIVGSDLSGNTVHTVTVRLQREGGTGTVSNFWRCTKADYSALQS